MRRVRGRCRSRGIAGGVSYRWGTADRSRIAWVEGAAGGRRPRLPRLRVQPRDETVAARLRGEALIGWRCW